MVDSRLKVLAVIGSLQSASVTRVVMHAVADQLTEAGCSVDILDLHKEPLPLYNPDTSNSLPEYLAAQPRVESADVVVLGTPDYHGSFSGSLKNFLDHFWTEFCGKLFAHVVASHEKGLTVLDQMRTVARQCYAWSLPYGVSCAEKTDVASGQIINPGFQKRLDMFVRDIRVYGDLLARQRRSDLEGGEPCFLARHRK